MSFELTFGLLAARHVITLFSFDRPLGGQITGCGVAVYVCFVKIINQIDINNLYCIF